MDHVAFITTEEGDDLIVSFAVVGDEPSEVNSIILLRTPKYEGILDEAERGVRFSDDRAEDDTWEMLRELHLKADIAAITTDQSHYEFDLSAVDPDEIDAASRVLDSMNFDHSFRLSLP